MLKTVIWQQLSAPEQQAILARPPVKRTLDPELINTLMTQVRQQGDAALKALTLRYDGATLDHLAVNAEEIQQANTAINTATLNALQQAITCLTKFHAVQKPQTYQLETAPGVYCELQSRAVNKVGLYVPGGTAPLISTVLMLGVPAALAGCPLRILCTPPNQQGKIHPAILVAAQLCGITKIYKVGGAQAIAAMAYGTETIPKVDKIFGPGNQFVTYAKMQVAQDPAGAGCDMPAGPSEVMVIADEDANPTFIAADLLAQAEHGENSQALLICTSIKLARAVQQSLQQQLAHLARKDIIQRAFDCSAIIVAETIPQAIQIANQYAPEHLILQTRQPEQYVAAISTAGSVFLGPWSPEAVGDYASGPNHVLPTYGFARYCSGLGVRDFMRTFSVQTLTQTGLLNLATTVTTLAELEGLDAHAQAIKVRVSS